MKTQTIRPNKMTLRPFFGRSANQTAHNLTSAVSAPTVATTHDHKEVTMKTQTSKRHTDALGVQRRTILTSMLNPGVLWRAFIMLVLTAAIVVPAPAQGIYVSNNPSVGVYWTYQAYINEYTFGGVKLPFLVTMPAKSWVDGFALFGPNLRVPYTNPSTDYGTVNGYSATTGAPDPSFTAFPTAPLWSTRSAAVLGRHLFVLYGYGIGEYDATTGSPSVANPLPSTYSGNYIAASPGPGGTVNLFVTENNGRPNNGYIQEFNVDPSLGTVRSSRTFAPGLNFPQGIAVSEDGNYVYVVLPNNNLPNTGEIDKYDAATGAPVQVPLVSGISGAPYAIAVHGSNLLVTLRDDNAIAEYDATNGSQIYFPPVTGLQFPTGIAVTPGDGTTFCTPPPSNLAAWYSFDQNLPSGAQYDLAKGNDATAYPAPPLGPQSVLGKVSNALSFNGTDDYVEAPDQPWLNMGRGDLSIDAWIKIAPGDDSGIRVLVDKRQSSPLQGYHFFLYNGQLGMQLADNISGWYNYLSTVPFSLADDQWHLIAVTVRRNSPIPVGTFYVDGISKGTFSPANRMGSLDNSGKLEIGVREASLGGGSFFKGALDEVEIFNKALGAGEVLSLYQAGSAGKCK